MELQKMLISKKSIVLVGADGTGKTTLARKINEKLGMPFEYHGQLLNFNSKKGIEPNAYREHVKNPGPLDEIRMGYMVESIREDMSQPLNMTPRILEGVFATKVYGLIKEKLFKGNDLCSIDFLVHNEVLVKEMLHQMAFLENIFFLDLDLDIIMQRIISKGYKGLEIFDRKAIEQKDTYPIFYNSVKDISVDVLGAKIINACNNPDTLADKIIKESVLDI